jgi:hypothetical protein
VRLAVARAEVAVVEHHCPKPAGGEHLREGVVVLSLIHAASLTADHSR